MKNTILQKGKELFLKEGFEKTSVQKIIDEIGIAKGTFYHYFNSKDEFLDEIIKDIYNKIYDELASEIDSYEGNAIEKLNQLFVFNKKIVRKHRGEFLDLKKEANMKFREKMREIIIEKYRPIADCIIKQGIEENIIHVKYADMIPMLIIRNFIGITMDFDVLFKEKRYDEMVRRIKMFEFVVERILGIDEGLIKIYDGSVLEEKINGGM